VPAAFVQFNIPVFGEANALPFIERLNFEVSGRYDHYYTFGVTTNPKVAFDWQLYDGVVLTGAWGTSFRAPGVADVSATGAQNRPHNQLAGNNNNDVPMCAPGATTPAPGSLGAQLNPTCSAALNFPGGIEISGGSLGAQVLRANGDGIPLNLGPEKATNISLGIDLLPNFLPGLEFRATYWNVYVNDFITGTSVNGNPLAATDPNYRHTFIVRGDPQFDADLAAVLALPNSITQPGLANNIQWIQDGANINAGYIKVSGIDFSSIYSREFMGGDVTAALSGTYYLRNKTQPIVGGPITDQFNAEGCKCNALNPRLKLRGQLGWTDGTYTVNTFVNYTSHYFANQASPPAAVLVNFPKYSDIVPAFTTVDLMFGYRTGDTPAQEYLKDVSFSVIVNDIFDKIAPFNYNVGGNASAFDSSQGETPFGRTITFILSKQF
jgi:iron complex outermembrane receptor protein